MSGPGAALEVALSRPLECPRHACQAVLAPGLTSMPREVVSRHIELTGELNHDVTRRIILVSFVTRNHGYADVQTGREMLTTQPGIFS